MGGKFAVQDNRETPETILATYQYPGFVMVYENRSANGRQINGHGYGIEFHGTDGTLFVDRSGLEIVPEQLRKRLDLRGDNTTTLVLTRVAGAGKAYLVEPL